MFIVQHQEQLKMCKTLDMTSSQNRDTLEYFSTQLKRSVHKNQFCVNLDAGNLVRRHLWGAPIGMQRQTVESDLYKIMVGGTEIGRGWYQ